MLAWLPEEETRTGGITAEGITKLLGAPDLEMVEVLVRETVQNSWDAGLDHAGPVHFLLKGRELSMETIEALRSLVFGESLLDTERAKAFASSSPLLEILSRERISGLYISDTGTRGLGGPTHAGTRAPDGVRTDFRDFVFKIGVPPDHEFGGGSYGFGKAVTYLASAARCIVVFSRTSKGADEPEARLIACGLGSSFHDGSRVYTGRHWWGEPSGDEVGPLTGREAEALAQTLGFESPRVGETGTSILIIEPDLGNGTLETSLRTAAWSITRNFWPKMIPLNQGTVPPMTFNITFEDSPIDVPHPDTTPPLHLHAASLRTIRAQEASTTVSPFTMVENPVNGDLIPVHLFEVASLRPKAALGHLAVSIGKVMNTDYRRAASEGPNGEPFSTPSHWAALLRQPELVVRYEAAVEHFAEGIEWGAVFKAAKNLDSVFRNSEPPAHDDWSPKALIDPHHRRYVNIALRRVPEMIRDLMDGEAPTNRSNPAWRIGTELGDLLPSVPLGLKKKKRRTGDPERKTTIRPQAVILSSQPTEFRGAQASRFTFVVRGLEDQYRVSIGGAVAAHEDGRPDTPCRILALGKSGAVTELSDEQDTCDRTIPVDEEWTVVIAQLEGFATALSLGAGKAIEGGDHP